MHTSFLLNPAKLQMAAPTASWLVWDRCGGCPLTSQKVFTDSYSFTCCRASSFRNIGGHWWTLCAESAFCLLVILRKYQSSQFCCSEVGQPPGPGLGHGYKDALILPMCHPPPLQWSAPKRTFNFINFSQKTCRKEKKKRSDNFTSIFQTLAASPLPYIFKLCLSQKWFLTTAGYCGSESVAGMVPVLCV